MTNILLRNIGDIWDKSEKRVTDKGSQNIINMAACRGISLARPGNVVIFPRIPHLDEYMVHVGEFLLPTAKKEDQFKHMQSALMSVDLPVGDAATEDYIDSPTLQDQALKAILNQAILDPYVDGERAGAFAEAFNCHYQDDFHPLFLGIRNKVIFHEFCQKASIPTIPNSVAAGRNGDYLNQCDDIFQAIESIFEKGYPSVMIRQAMAAGGIGNARIDKVGGHSYRTGRGKLLLEGKAALKDWLVNDFYRTSLSPGMMVAPYFGEGISLSGMVEIRDGKDLYVPYVAQEVLNEAGTSFMGAKIENNLPQELIDQAKTILKRAGEVMQAQGIQNGILQMDMRTVEGQVCGVESNAMRKTAVIELFQIMSKSKHWVEEGAERLNEGKQRAFMSVEHIPVSQAFENTVKEKGFNEAFNEFRVISPEQYRQFSKLDYQGEPLDIGTFLHACTPPHFITKQMNIGLITADEAIRPKRGQSSVEPIDSELARLNLDQKWDLVKSVFQ